MTGAKLYKTNEDPIEARLTSRQLASLYCLSRDQAEDLLTRLGLRHPADDGNTKYSMAEIENALEQEDASRVSAAAELTDRFANASLVARAVREAFDELKRQWVGEHGLHEDLVAMKEAVLAKLRKSHSFQRARRAGDAWAELGVIETFEQSLLDAIRERRQPAEAKTEEDHSDVRV